MEKQKIGKFKQRNKNETCRNGKMENGKSQKWENGKNEKWQIERKIKEQ